MTNKELTSEVRKIWKDACDKTAKLVKEQKFKIFDDSYSFHRYVKHGDTDGLITSGKDLLRLFLKDCIHVKRDFIIATPEEILLEKKKCRKDAIKECQKQISYAKETIIEKEAFLAELLSDKKEIEYDSW